MKLKIVPVQYILYQFNIFCTGTKTNCTKVQIELQHIYICTVFDLILKWEKNFVSIMDIDRVLYAQ